MSRPASHPDKEQVVVRMDLDLYQRLKAEATAQERSVSQQIRLLVRQWLDSGGITE